MLSWLSAAFQSTSNFMPHGMCYLWIPSLLWLHVVSDVLIGTAYLGISIILYILVRRIRLPFSPVFIAFGLFIALCGLTHFMAVWTVWNPDYWLDGFIKAATAAASAATAIGLFFVKPQVEEVVHAARLSEERRIQLEASNAELESLYQKLIDQDQLKSEFFANVSHELRTPLALLLGPAERMADDTNLNSDQRRQLESISRNGKTLLKQVNDLLDIAKLEQGKMQIQYLRLDLAPWFRRIASQFAVAAEHRGIQYRLVSPETLVAEVAPDKLERVLINLLSNALKFTPEGGEVCAELSSGNDEFSLAVSDTGPGISQEQQEAIFERFRQADGGATRNHGGTGLGLAIAKDFVELHQGKIELGSTLGGGSRFTVRLPLRAPVSVSVEDAGDPAPNPTTEVALDSAMNELDPRSPDRTTGEDFPDLPGRPSVLIVEDTAEMSQFIASVLVSEFNVVTAADGVEGLEKACALDPALIISDVMMPRMSGDQLVMELRKREQFRSTPILLLTAKADDELRVALLKAGAQDYVTKPFLAQELMARASNLIAVKRAGDTLRLELASASNDLESLARELAIKHRQLETALDATEVARAEVERASQVKSRFLALISHELRTPLSTIQLNTQLLNRDPDVSQSTAFKTPLNRTVRASQQMATLVEGLLEYTRFENGRIPIHQEPTDVLAVAREVVEMGQLQITSPEVNLLLEPPAENLRTFVTDPKLLRVILNNLISNALKFTRRGTISLHLRAAGHWWIFEVQDTGIGIPQEDIPRIFMPFERLEPLQRKTIPGVGLGLSLTKEIAEALGGKVEVESEPDKGSVFRVLLPAQTATAGLGSDQLKGTDDDL